MTLKYFKALKTQLTEYLCARWYVKSFVNAKKKEKQVKATRVYGDLAFALFRRFCLFVRLCHHNNLTSPQTKQEGGIIKIIHILNLHCYDYYVLLRRRYWVPIVEPFYFALSFRLIFFRRKFESMPCLFYPSILYHTQHTPSKEYNLTNHECLLKLWLEVILWNSAFFFGRKSCLCLSTFSFSPTAVSPSFDIHSKSTLPWMVDCSLGCAFPSLPARAISCPYQYNNVDYTENIITQYIYILFE